MKPSYPFRRTCKEATALMVAREDRGLAWADRLGLQLHLAMCRTCPGFERQMLTMRNAMKQWRHYAADDSTPD
jgi:Putative zinc-finger